MSELRALPSDPTTVCSYIGPVFQNNTVRGGSIRPYIAAIAARHRQNGLQSPTDHPLVPATRRGYRTQDVRRATGAPIRSTPLPSSVAALALRRAIADPPSLTDAMSTAVAAMRSLGLLAVNFLICARPGSVREILATDVRVGDAVVELQLRTFKYAETGVVPRIALRVPVSSPVDVRVSFCRLLQAAPPSGYLFPDVSGRKPSPAALLNRAVHFLVAETQTVPPLGMKFTPRSLRIGGISAAYAAGVPMPVIMRLSNHFDEQVVRRHYLDPQTVATPDSDLFFARFRPAPQGVSGFHAGRDV